MSQPEMELDNDVEHDGDDAVLDQLAERRKTQDEPEAEKAPDTEQDEGGAEQEADEEQDGDGADADEDPEFDLGDLKAKKSEILAWKAGEMKDADYRRKTAEAAEAKRHAQAIAERVELERTHYVNHLDTLIDQMQAELIGDQQALAQLAIENPNEWVVQNAYFTQRANKFQQAVQERQVLGQRQQEEAERRQNDWMDREREAALSKLPAWRDDKVRNAELQGMTELLEQAGFGDNEMSPFLDHRALLILRDAWQAKVRAAARGTVKNKQVQSKPPAAIRPGAESHTSQPSQDEYKALQKKARSGREDDILALMAAKRRNA